MGRLKRTIKNTIAKTGFAVTRLKNTKVEGQEVPSEDYLRHTDGTTNYYETPIGNYFLPNDAPDDVVINSMKKGYYFEKHIITIAERYIKEGSAVLDIGANFGQMSICFAKISGMLGKVYSFDADDYVYTFLLKNIRANGCLNIEPIFGAVYNELGKTVHFPKQDFIRFGSYGSYGLNPLNNEGRKVKTITIDSLDIKRHISFMKVDIQGSDLFALQGAVNTINRNKMPIIFEFEQQFQEDFNTTFQDYVDFAEQISYRFQEVVGDVNYLLLPK